MSEYPEFLPCQDIDDVSPPTGEMFMLWYNYKHGRNDSFSGLPPDNLLSDYLPQSTEAQELFWSYVNRGTSVVASFTATLSAVIEDLEIEKGTQ